VRIGFRLAIIEATPLVTNCWPTNSRAFARPIVNSPVATIPPRSPRVRGIRSSRERSAGDGHVSQEDDRRDVEPERDEQQRREVREAGLRGDEGPPEEDADGREREERPPVDHGDTSCRRPGRPGRPTERVAFRVIVVDRRN
jgi:hypothetical protein